MTDTPVTQADREAAASIANYSFTRAEMIAGKLDDSPAVQAFARHRSSSTASSVDVDAVAKIIDPDAWHETLPTDGCGVYWIGRRNKARSQAKAIAALHPEQADPGGREQNKAGGLWYRRWHAAQTRVNELEVALANTPAASSVSDDRLALQDLLKWADNVCQAHKFGPQKAVERARAALANTPAASSVGADAIAWLYEGPDGEHYIREHRDNAPHWLAKNGWKETPLVAALATTPAQEVDETERMPALGDAEWMNLMPREVVARAALAEGCRDKTAADIRAGLHHDVKIRAEVAVKLVASIQNEVRAALTDKGEASRG